MAPPPDAAIPSSSGSVSFKAYFTPHGDDKPKEVRRFGMEQNEVTSFDLLKEKLRQVFPSLAKAEFTITWKDFEDDDIIISSNEELLTALTESSGQVHRLYIVGKNPAPALMGNFYPFGGWKRVDGLVAGGCPAIDPVDVIDSDEDDDDIVFTPPGCKRSWHSALRAASVKVHPNVYCDGCNKNIDGHRYKCMECDDFDLCHACESQLKHKEHVMLRIPLTMSHYTKLNNFSKSMRYMTDALHKIDSRYKKQERRMHKLMEMNKRCDDILGVAEEMIHCSKRCKRDEKEKEKKEKRDRKEKRESRDRASFSEAQAGSSANASASAHASSRAKSSSSKDKPSPTSETSDGACPFPAGILNTLLSHEGLNNFLKSQNLTTLQRLFEQMSPVPETLLQEVAQNFADVTLNDSQKRQPVNVNAGNPFYNYGKKDATDADGAGPSSSGNPAEMQDKAQAVDSSAPNTQASGESASNLLEPSLPESLGSEDGDAEEWTVVDPQVRKQSAVAEDKTTSRQVRGDDQSTAEDRTNGSSVYPKLPEVETSKVPPTSVPSTPLPPVYHQDPEVQKCLRALADMGYDVSQQLIIDIAEEYKGNLSRVLNVLLS